MSYISRDQIIGRIPPSTLSDALDDNRDGVEDDGLLDAIIANASSAVDGYLAGIYPTPFSDPAPAVVRAATLAFVIEELYIRRQVEKPAAVEEQSKFFRTRLEKIGNRELPLDASQVKAFTPGAAITSAIKVNAQST
jgi:phage gp36-like protein